jgi:hypothetical protein
LIGIAHQYVPLRPAVPIYRPDHDQSEESGYFGLRCGICHARGTY